MSELGRVQRVAAYNLCVDADDRLLLVRLSERTEASTRGAALLALEAAGRIDSISDFPVSVATTFEPDMSCHVRYQEGLKRQQQLYDRVIAKT